MMLGLFCPVAVSSAACVTHLAPKPIKSPGENTNICSSDKHPNLFGGLHQSHLNTPQEHRKSQVVRKPLGFLLTQNRAETEAAAAANRTCMLHKSLHICCITGLSWTPSFSFSLHLGKLHWRSLFLEPLYRLSYLN